MSARARVAVMGATAEDPPPGIGAIADTVDLAFADDVPSLAGALEGSDVLFAWRPQGALLSGAWGSAADLQWIQSASAGVDNLLFPELAASHVVLTNARGVYEDAIAEYVLGLLLAFAKGIGGVFERQGRREWRHNETERLERKRVLVVGIGPIGRAIARTCAALRMSVRGVARTARPGDDVLVEVFGAEQLTDAVRSADYVIDALPATDETHHLFDHAVFEAMEPWTRFVNVGRGSTVDQRALVRALETG
ncbi:MAG TPA: NAD(P)-dependent oxidoreductase, partial [Actinomycetota bacterium]|nr:NAD(P)-dependent oxidoreductase [Actinomycetota bacterium]